MKQFFGVVVFLMGFTVRAQDVVFSQNFLVPETLSSSFAGSSRGTKMGSLFRSQWRNATIKTNSKFAFVDTWFERYNIGIGLKVLQQKESASNYQFNQINFDYAVSYQLTRTWFFRPSVSVGWADKSYGFQNLLFEDQINFNSGTSGSTTIDPLFLKDRRGYFDFSASLLFNNEDSWFGITAKHVNTPNISLAENGEVPLDIFWSAHGKYYLSFLENISSRFRRYHRVYAISNFMLQGRFNKLDIGAQYVYYNQFSVGLTMSTAPLDIADNSRLITSLSAFTGFKWKRFRFGYSYDVNTSDLIRTGGVHEFSICYNFYVNIRSLARFKCGAVYK